MKLYVLPSDIFPTPSSATEIIAKPLVGIWCEHILQWRPHAVAPRKGEAIRGSLLPLARSSVIREVYHMLRFAIVLLLLGLAPAQGSAALGTPGEEHCVVKIGRAHV